MLMGLQIVKRALIFVAVCDHLSQLLKFQGLYLAVSLRLEKVIAVSEISVGKFHLIQFVFNHYLIGKHVVKRPDIGVIRRENCRTLD
jgi:hypothetical protein